MRIRTGFSFRTAVGHLPEVLDRIQEIGWKCAPISDRNSTFGFVKWMKLVKETKLRPIYGTELAVVPELGAKKPIADFWTFFARDSLVSLNELVYEATANDPKFPSITYERARAITDLIKITGERTLLDRLNPGDAHVGLSPSLPRGLYIAARERGFEFLATSDNVYTRPTDREFYRVAIGFNRSSTQTYPQHILSDSELRRSLSLVGDGEFREAIKNRNAAFKQSKAELPLAELLSPKKPKTLRQLCEEGARRVGVDLSDAVYAARLERELGLIAEKKFEDYFFIIADLMQAARKMMVVGPARGSSCGSLVCYLLGITAIDPIPHDLVFERFIDTTRSDLPDIDLDFSDVRRHLIFEYMEKKYGDDRVARLGSVNMFKAKSALNSAAIALRIPDWKINEVSNTVIKRSFGDSRASSTVEDTLRETTAGQELLKEYPEAILAGRLEGHPSNPGQHAAGMVLTNKPIINFVAVDARNGVAMCDKYDAETLNLLKIDMLGLTQLSVFERTLELIGEKQTSDFLEAIPLDDPTAFDVLNNFRFAGVFQFVPGSTSSDLVKELVLVFNGKIESIEDIVALTALVRPGPLASGATDAWLRRRTGFKKVDLIHPKLEPYISKTLGIIVYQEQVLQIGREIGGLSWDEVTQLRKAMSKSLGKEYFDQFGDKWKAGAMKEMPDFGADRVDKFWDDLCTYGMWAFNRSHSVAYGLVSYWCCWLKAHHSVEFAAATLDALKDVDKQIASLREMKKEGIEYVAIDPETSTDRWEIGEKDGKRILVGPLTNIKGIGPAFVNEIVDDRRKGGLAVVRDTLLKKIERAETPIDSLTPIADAVERLYPEGLEEVNILSTVNPIAEVVPDGKDRTVLVVGKVIKMSPLNENELARIQKRDGRVYQGPTDALNLFLADDSGEIFCKIGRFEFGKMGKDVIEQTRVGRSLYAVKGVLPRDFRMIRVMRIKYLGETDKPREIEYGSSQEETNQEAATA